MRAVLGLAAVLAACYSPNPKAGVPCAANGACPAGQTCDMSTLPPTCQSVAGGGDGGADGAGSADAAVAVGCRSDAECSGGVCTEFNGQCVSDSNVLFVAPAATGSCTHSSPCAMSTAMAMLSQPRHTVVLLAGSYGTQLRIPATSINGTIVISGEPGATIGAATIGALVQSDSSSVPVVVEGVTIAGGSSDGVSAKGPLTLSHVVIQNNGGRGVAFSPAGSPPLAVLDSVIRGNASDGLSIAQGTFELRRSIVADNQGVGVRVSRAPTTIVNTVVAHNGTAMTNNAAILFQNLQQPPVMAFTTVAANLSATGVPAAVSCDQAMTFDSSIFVDNGPSGSPQLGFLCSATYSLFPAGAPNGTMGSNLVGPADFVDEAGGDFHILPTSAARGAGDTAATVTDDLDGEMRPQGAIDIGADEIP